METPLEVYETLPIVPLRDVVVFPHMMMPFVIGRPSSTRALEHALLKDKRIFLAAQHDASVDDPRPEDIFTMGSVANVVQSLKLPDGNIKVLVEGIERVVVVTRVMMERDEPPDRGELREGQHVVNARVPPANAFLVFIRGVLRIVDQQVHACGEVVAGGPTAGGGEGSSTECRLMIR